MTSHVQRGDLAIQCNKVSSSSDFPRSSLNSQLIVIARPTYRNRRPMREPLFNEANELDPFNPILCHPRANDNSISTRLASISVGLIFITSLIALFLVYSTFPTVTEEEKKHIKIPWNIEDAKQLAIVLNRYKADHYYQVLCGVFVTYIFLQTFAIPGSLFLSILSGFLFPFTIALILVCTCSALGASLCFLLSHLLGRKLIQKYFPKKAEEFAAHVNHHRDNLFNYIVFLRVTPFLPNWLINLTAPVIGVPLFPFAFGTFLGVAPPSFIAIQTGQTLHEVTVHDTAFNISSVIWLIVFGFISLIPIFLKEKFKKKME